MRKTATAPAEMCALPGLEFHLFGALLRVVVQAIETTSCTWADLLYQNRVDPRFRIEEVVGAMVGLWTKPPYSHQCHHRRRFIPAQQTHRTHYQGLGKAARTVPGVAYADLL
jgi:hypothetical protein